jgi:hypothetical protein
MVEEKSDLKESSKELILSAIKSLRRKGAEINPYTVATEADMPRSTIYRNAEFMDLISREKAEPAEKLAATQPGFPDRVTELEAEIEELGQTIWNLEKQNEDLQKDFQDAWAMGFAAGLEEAKKRHARGIAQPANDTMQPSPWPALDRYTDTETFAQKTTHDDQGSNALPSNALPSDAPPLVDELGEEDTGDSPLFEEQKKLPSPARFEKRSATVHRGPDTGDHPVYVEESRPALKAEQHPAKSEEQPSDEQPKVIAEGGARIAPHEIRQEISLSAAERAAEDDEEEEEELRPVISDRFYLADEPLDEFSAAKTDLNLELDFSLMPELLASAQREIQKADEAHRVLQSRSSDSDNEAIYSDTKKSSNTAPNKSSIIARDKTQPPNGYQLERKPDNPAYTLDFSQDSSQSDAIGTESGLNISTISQHSASNRKTQTHAAADLLAAEHSSKREAGIYNVVRSGPYVASEFNPLIELSWKDIEDVYNYRASTLKDYARNVPSAPNKLSSSVTTDHKRAEVAAGQPRESTASGSRQPQLSPEPLSTPKSNQAAVYMTDEETDVVPEASASYQHKPDPDITGDRIQAMIGYLSETDQLVSTEHSVLAESAAAKIESQFSYADIVDLDSVDIFEDIDEWVEGSVGKSENSQAAAAISRPGKNEELSEVIKKRIEQAGEVSNETPPPRGLNADKPASLKTAEPAGIQESSTTKPKNKFIGGKVSQEAPQPSPNMPFVKQIPADIRKACLILGVRSEDMTSASVTEAWKRQIVEVHPDQGGDAETAVILNTAKDTLVRWIDAQAPKLGKKFGSVNKDSLRKEKDKS